VRANLAALAGAREFITRQSVAATAVRFAAHAGDDDVLKAALDIGLLDEAETGGNEFAVATLAAAFGLGFERLGNAPEAQSMFERSGGAISSAYGHALEIATIALYCPDRARRLHEIVAREPGGAQNRVDIALIGLIDAILARRNGDEQGTQACALEAAQGFSEIGWPLLSAACRELAGDQAGALAIYRRSGAFGDVRRIERPTLERAAQPARGLLTPRERDVARLIAAGKANQATADALGISRKAVEKYLTAIYEKLGVTSRAQLAVYMVSSQGPDSAPR
jgi:DNA-binding CsgD family transcriptional regulator